MESELNKPSTPTVPIRLEGIGTRIGAAADLLGSRKNAASAANSSVDSLQRWIRDENMPAFDAAARLCLAAGVRLHWLATGEDPMLMSAEQLVASRVEEAPAAYQDAQDGDLRDQAFLTAALRIVDDRLHNFGLREHAKPDEFAELVRFVLADLKRGAAEDAASAALARVLNMTRAPHQP